MLSAGQERFGLSEGRLLRVRRWVHTLSLLTLGIGGVGSGAITAASSPGPGPYSVAHWGTDLGFVAGQVNAVSQTRDGYLWFGADEGLARFDGAHFEIFNEHHAAGLGQGRISALHEDQAGRLWIGVRGGGLLQYHLGTFRHYGGEEGLDNEQVSTLAEDATGRLWIGTDGGGLFQLNGERVEVRQPGGSEFDPFVTAMELDRQGFLWIGSQSGLLRIRGDESELFSLEEVVGGKDCTALYCDAEGVVWIGSGGGLAKYDEGLLSVSAWPVELRNVQAICGEEDGGLWVGTAFGLHRLASDQATTYSAETGLSGNLISSLWIDHEGSVWVGSDTPGIDQIRATKFGFITTAHGLSHPTVTCIYEDSEGAIWLGGHKGLHRMQDGSITAYGKREGLVDNLVFTACEALNGDLWIGSLRGLNCLIDGTFQDFSDNEGLPSRVVWCSYRDQEGAVWIGTRDGATRIHSGTFELFNHDRNGLSHNDVRVFCEDREGMLWVGTSYGLNRLEDGRFVNYFEAAPDEPFNVVLALHCDGEGTLWIGTMDNGLFRYRDGRFTHYGVAEGLFDELVYQILEDDLGHLWLSCNRGIYRLDKEELNAFADGKIERIHSESYGRADGLLSVECNGTIQPAGCRTGDGRLWFPTAKGAAVIDPSRIRRNNQPPPVVIQEVRLDGEVVDGAGVTRISAEIDRVDIHYAALSFLVPEAVRFRYRLAGIDRDWIDVGSERVAHFTHLPAGRFVFEVIACNNDGVWNEVGATLALQVIPPWWRSTWFLFLGFVAGVGGIAGALRYLEISRFRRRMVVLERERTLERERSRIAQDMHDGLGASLVKISLLGDIAEGQVDEPETARAHLRKISSAARDVLRSLDEIVWAVNPKNDTVENVANYLCQFAREHFLDTNIDCELDAATDLPNLPLAAEARHNLFLSVKEALNNVVKHSTARTAQLTVRVVGQRLEVLVHDDGRGMPDGASRPKGNGLSNMKTRLAAIGGETSIQSGPEKGTTVTFSVPLIGSAPKRP